MHVLSFFHVYQSGGLRHPAPIKNNPKILFEPTLFATHGNTCYMWQVANVKKTKQVKKMSQGYNKA